MSNETTAYYLPTNFREAFTILESYRVAPCPGRGMRHISQRPVLSDGLRETEGVIITAGKPGEFPILLELKDSLSLSQADASFQTDVLPLAKIHTMVFRHQDELDLFASKSFDNASMEGVPVAVCPALFSLPGDARFLAGPKSAQVETAGWKYADQICGLVAAVLKAADVHPAARSIPVVAMVPGFKPAVILELISRNPDARDPAQALAGLMRRYHGQIGLDPLRLLDDALLVLRNTDVEPRKLAAFDRLVRGILASDFTRRSGSLSDDGDVPLRALMLVIQRESTADILSDRINGELPGPLVYTFAAMLAGMREGLAHMPVDIKGPYASLLGELGAAAEGHPDNQPRLSEILGRLGNCAQSAAPEIEKAVQPCLENSAETTCFQGAEVTILPVCTWPTPAVARRIFEALSDTPANWRIVLAKDGELVLKVSHYAADETFKSAEAEIEAAKVFVANCTQRARRRKRAAGSVRPAAVPDSTPKTLPGLLDTLPSAKTSRNAKRKRPPKL